VVRVARAVLALGLFVFGMLCAMFVEVYSGLVTMLIGFIIWPRPISRAESDKRSFALIAKILRW
jgi:hypothetical protein